MRSILMTQSPGTSVELTPDCSKCIGLCCVGLAFDRSAFFAFDKPAGEVCRNLDSSHRCRIHTHLEEAGFRGCVQFDCLGAGQRATALFDAPRHDGSMFAAFSRMREIHELLQLLDQAAQLPLEPVQRRECQGLRGTLAADWTLEAFESLDLVGLKARVKGFLKSLKDLVSA